MSSITRPIVRFVLVVGLAGLTAIALAPSVPAVPPVASEATAPVMVVLDASGSMRASDAPGSRIAAAKRAVSGLVGSLPAGARIGLEVYGTSTGSSNAEKAAGCKDIKVLVPVGTLDRASFLSQVGGIRASGYTPIGESLRTAAAALPKEGPRSIVLVSDGEDTCAPPSPCDVARELKRQGVDLTVHTVGFKVDAKARGQLECIAQATGGSYRDAKDGPSLSDELGKQVQRAIRGYEAQGRPVHGGGNANAAPELTPGQYVDRFAHGASSGADEGSTKFYAVNLAAGDTPYISATLVPLARRAVAYSTMQIKVSVSALDDGTGCTETASDYDTVTNGKAAAVTAVVAPGATGGDDSCLKPGPAVIKVQRPGTAFGDVPLDVELAYRVEHPADASGLPGPAEPLANKRVGLVGTPNQIDSGSSFNNAPRVRGGVYSDSFTPGETRYLKVAVGWGQRVAFSYASAGQPGYEARDQVPAEVRLADPLREESDSAIGSRTSDTYVGADYSSMYGSSAVPVRYRNRESDSSDVRRYSLAGDYYLVLSTGFADSGRSAAIPYTIRVEVTGGEQGPDYTRPGPSSSGPSPSGPNSSTSASSTAASSGPASAPTALVAGSRNGAGGVPTPLLAGGIIGAALLLAGAAAAFMARRRRVPDQYPTVDPGGY